MKSLSATSGQNDAELKLQIAKAIKYLLERKARDQLLTDTPSFDYGGFLAKLGSAESELRSAVKHLQRLETDFVLGHLDAYHLSAHRIHSAYESAANALAEIQVATNETKIFHAPPTRAKVLQKSAARLAYSLVGGHVKGQARAVAIEIMDGANLENPEKSALTRWIKEFKTETSM